MDVVRAGTNDCAVLLAGSDTLASQQLVETLRRARIGVVYAPTVNHLRSALADADFDVVIASHTDNFMNGELPSQLRHLCPEIPLIFLVDDAPVDRKRWASHACEVIAAPTDEVATLDAIRRAVELGRNTREAVPLAPLPSLNDVPVRSAAMQSVIGLLERVAPGNATIMLRGESGTGKEVVAKRIHALSRRSAGPLVSIHCAALPEQILESELFGYERGAFTGAHSRKPGRVELAERGTLFLDEIGEVSPAVQVKLLRLLQERRYERLGGTHTLAADVRFITATHRNLEQMVRTGAFREDLYYRLNVVRIDLPPLRERRDDIAALVRHFCEQTSQDIGRHIRLTTAAVRRLEAAEWRGNVRELQNFVERMGVMAERDEIGEEDVLIEQERAIGLAGLPAEHTESSVISLDKAVRRAERKALEKALRKAGGNRTLAARILGVSRRALFYKARV